MLQQELTVVIATIVKIHMSFKGSGHAVNGCKLFINYNCSFTDEIIIVSTYSDCCL